MVVPAIPDGHDSCIGQQKMTNFLAADLDFSWENGPQICSQKG